MPDEIFNNILRQGQSYFDNLMLNPTVETDMLDFKEVSNSKSTVLSADDSRELSKAICGFGNMDGGVIVWGVKCKADKADGRDIVKQLCPFDNLNGFLANLQNYTAQATDPPVAGVKHHRILAENETDKGYAITLVPKIDGLPVLANHKDLKKGIFYRSGCSFQQMTQTMIADRFGRRPQAKLTVALVTEPQSNQTVKITLGIANEGRGLATSVGVRLWNFVLPIALKGRVLPLLTARAGITPSGDGQTVCLPEGVSIPPNMVYALGSADILPGHLVDFQFPISFYYSVFAEGCSDEGEIILETSHLYKAFWLDSAGAREYG